MATVFVCTADNCNINFPTKEKLLHHILFIHKTCSYCALGQDQILNSEQHAVDKGHVICNLDQCSSLLKTTTQLGTHRRKSHQTHVKVTNRATNLVITKGRLEGKFVCGC